MAESFNNTFLIQRFNSFNHSPSTSPIKCLFLQRVKITGRQNRKKRNHRTQNEIPCRVIREHVAVNDRPRIKKHNFDVEQDEQHCHEIKFHGKPRVAFADGVFAALVSRVFGAGAFAALAEKD